MDIQDYIDQKLVHEIHTSERKSFRACRRRWDWIFRQNYYPLMTAKPLEFGVAYHAAMEVYYEPRTWHNPKEVVAEEAIMQFQAECEDQRKRFLRQEGVQYLEEEVQEDYDERLELGEGMLRHYFTNVAPEYDKHFTPVRVEIPFMVPISNPETGEDLFCKCDQCWVRWLKHLNAVVEPGNTEQLAKWLKWPGLPVVYAGRIDALVEDEFGDLWIVDWKTARSLSTGDEFLYLDDQVGGYVWVLRSKIGLNVRGFVYVEMKKGYPQAPSRNVNRRLGRAFSVAKNQDTDYDTYLATVSLEDEEAYKEGLYDDFLQWLKDEGPKFQQRFQIHKSDNELASIGENIFLEALDIIDPKLRIYPSAGRFGCGFCAFRQPCLEKNAKGDYKYILDTLFEQREHYYVRPEPSTESKGGE